jgi:hypothetical protein
MCQGVAQNLRFYSKTEREIGLIWIMDFQFWILAGFMPLDDFSRAQLARNRPQSRTFLASASALARFGGKGLSVSAMG